MFFKNEIDSVFTEIEGPLMNYIALREAGEKGVGGL